MRRHRISTSWMEKVEAWPMCNSPVTLGSGSMMTNGCRDGSTAARKYPAAIHVLYRAISTWRGSYVVGNVLVDMIRLVLKSATAPPPKQITPSSSGRGFRSVVPPAFRPSRPALHCAVWGASPPLSVIASETSSRSLRGDLPRHAASGDLPTAESPSLGGRAGTPPPHCFARIIARFTVLSKRLPEHRQRSPRTAPGESYRYGWWWPSPRGPWSGELHGSATAATPGESASSGALRLENLSTLLRDARLRAGDGTGCRR